MAEGGPTRPDDATRLEAALDRIARRRPGGQAAVRATIPPVLVARLDALIADLRAVLGRDSAD